MSALYATKPWRELRSRVLSTDADCYLSGIAGDCRGDLLVHHVIPVSDGGPEIPGDDGVRVLCKRHHSMLHGFLRRQASWKRCPHQHRSLEARRLCEERLNRAA